MKPPLALLGPQGGKRKQDGSIKSPRDRTHPAVTLRLNDVHKSAPAAAAQPSVKPEPSPIKAEPASEEPAPAAPAAAAAQPEAAAPAASPNEGGLLFTFFTPSLSLWAGMPSRQGDVTVLLMCRWQVCEHQWTARRAVHPCSCAAHHPEDAEERHTRLF
jgi:hypothetical protein